MPAPRRYRAPAAGGVLADPPLADAPGLAEQNRRRLDAADIGIGGVPLRELRRLARREVLEAAAGYLREAGEGAAPSAAPDDAPLFLSGHQPELFHPGVWVKNFALSGLARRAGGVALNLVVDNDAVKSTAVRFPTWDGRDPGSVHLQSVPFDRFEGAVPYEDRAVHDPELFSTFPDRTALLWKNWGFEPLLPAAWKHIEQHPAESVGERFASARRCFERQWGCRNLELPVSRLAGTRAFATFAGHLLSDLPRFAASYNAAVRGYRAAHGMRNTSHPVPDLVADGEWQESPFWVWRFQPKKRQRLLSRLRPEARGIDLLLESAGPPVGVWDQAHHTPDEWWRSWRFLAEQGYRVRPRALTLTLFARVCLGDLFVHGIGGGKYDEVTDALIRGYFGIDPPGFAVLSATVSLPVPTFPATPADVRGLARRERDLLWKPERYAGRGAEALANEKAALAAAEPTDPSARRQWYHDLRRTTEGLRPFVADHLAATRRGLTLARREAAANAALGRRDFSWVLYPEATLRPFLQGFL